MGARSTVKGSLALIEAPFAEPPAGAERLTGLFSLVIYPSEVAGPRRLPAFYHGRAQVFSDRDLNKVMHVMSRAIQRAAESTTRRLYMATGCELDGRRGVWYRNIFNRAKERMDLKKKGFVFSTDPYVELQDDGTFVNDDWGNFEATFVVSTRMTITSPRGAEEQSPGESAFALGAHRIGPIDSEELLLLTDLIRRVPRLLTYEFDGIQRILALDH